jgi:pimeloyl-ACP methyl ester carboxylesterase
MSTHGTGSRPPSHPADPAQWRHETARVNGVDLHYVTVPPDPDAVDHPTGAAPLVVLLHGFPSFWYAWRHQLDPLAAAGYRVVAPDLRGYNRSSSPSGVDSYRPSTLAADIRGLIEHRGAPQATVVGHDWGGLVAWETAIREPDVVGRLATLNAPHPAVYRRSLTRSPAQLLRSWYVFPFQLPWLPERLLGAGEFTLLEQGLTEAAGPGTFTEDELERYRAAMARTDSLTGPLNYYRAMAQTTVEQGVRSLLPGDDGRDPTVEAPTLVLWGEQDPVLGAELLGGLDRWVPDLRVRRLPEAGHWVHLDAPGRVTDGLGSLLAEPPS